MEGAVRLTFLNTIAMQLCMILFFKKAKGTPFSHLSRRNNKKLTPSFLVGSLARKARPSSRLSAHFKPVESSVLYVARQQFLCAE
jgi:hypothetical protein